jgi:GTP-binding protein HflX
MFERPGGGEKAVLVQLDFGQGDVPERLEELKLLAASAGAATVAVVQGRRERPDPALFAGKGKVAEVADAIRDAGADIAIFNHEISAAQQRNLEKELGCRVVDRASLILDIFAQRAKSHEGKLQVELAQLQHMATRLVRGWTHLERQKGGIGLRGPGETQLETDRRLLGKRVKVLKDRLKQLERQRAVRRRARTRRDMLAVSLVGYTNAGKSTLFNALTKAGAYAADQLSPRWIPPRGACIWRGRGRWSSPTRSVSSATCRILSSRHSMPRWKRRQRPICCFTWWIRPAPIVMRR